MYFLSIVDSNNNGINIMHTRSQIKMDEFTTCFVSKEALLRKLGLDETSFNVKLYRNSSNEKVDIPFLTSKFRNAIKLNDDNRFRIKLITDASNYDKDTIYRFFLDELLRYDKVLSDYDKDRKEKLVKLIDMFSNEKKTITNNELYPLIRNYMIDKFNKPNYSSLKRLYVYLSNLGLNYGADYTVAQKQEVNDILSRIKGVLDDSITPDKREFVRADYKEDGIIDLDDNDELEDVINNVNIKDIDTMHDELDMYMDKKKMDLEQKQEFIEKNKKRIYNK